MRPLPLLPLALATFVLALPVPAAHAVHRQEVLVEGQRERSATLPDIEAARRRIELTPGGAGIVDAEERRSGRASTLQDLLGYAAGVFVQPRFGSDEARLSIRGSGLQRTFHLRGIKLLQDGVPLSAADGGGDFQAIDGLSTRYVEIYRGANALRYGGTTLGGAINLVSPSGRDAPHLQGRIEGGSHSYLRAQAAAAGADDRHDWFLSATHADQEGFRAHADQNNERLSGNLGLRLAANLETRFFVAAADSRSRLPGNLTRAQLERDPNAANPLNVLGNQKRDFDLWRLSNRTVWAFGAQRVELGTFYACKDLYHPIFQVLDVVSDEAGADLRYVSEAPLLGRANFLVVGFSPTAGVADDDRFVNLGGGRGARTGASEQTSVNLDLYVEEQHYVLPELALVAGVQISHATRELDDAFLANGDNGVDRTYTATSPKFGARWEFDERAQVFANVSRSFEPPSFGELAGGPGVTPVDAQTAWTFELGTRGTLERLGATWDAAYYRAAVQDELLSLTDALGNPLGTVNARDTLHQGLEVGLVNRIFDRLVIRQAWLWNDFRFDGDPIFGDNRLAGVPEHLYRAEFVYEWPQGWYFGPSVEWVPGDYAVDHANTLDAEGYAIVGAKGGWRGPGGLAFFVEGRNLADANYAASTGVTANARGIDQALFLPGDGASVFVGLQYRR